MALCRKAPRTIRRQTTLVCCRRPEKLSQFDNQIFAKPRAKTVYSIPSRLSQSLGPQKDTLCALNCEGVGPSTPYCFQRRIACRFSRHSYLSGALAQRQPAYITVVMYLLDFVHDVVYPGVLDGLDADRLADCGLLHRLVIQLHRLDRLDEVAGVAFDVDGISHR